MRTKKDIEKTQDSISPEISPGIPALITRTGKISSIINQQETETLLDLDIEKRT